MNPTMSTYYNGVLAGAATESERVAFIQRTYLHLALAILAFVGVETVLMMVIPGEVVVTVLEGMMSSRIGWLIFLGAFMGVSWIARSWAESGSSPVMQYAGLSLYVVAEAIFFLPLLYVAVLFASPNVLPTSIVITMCIFSGLTLSVFVSNADFSWLRSALWIGGMAAMGFILCMVVLPLFGFDVTLMDLVFPYLMVVLASGYILYDTSNVLHHYRTDQHVAASLALFASLALLFWYILQIVMRFSRR